MAERRNERRLTFNWFDEATDSVPRGPSAIELQRIEEARRHAEELAREREELRRHQRMIHEAAETTIRVSRNDWNQRYSVSAEYDMGMFIGGEFRNAAKAMGEMLAKKAADEVCKKVVEELADRILERKLEDLTKNMEKIWSEELSKLCPTS